MKKKIDISVVIHKNEKEKTITKKRIIRRWDNIGQMDSTKEI